MTPSDNVDLDSLRLTAFHLRTGAAEPHHAGLVLFTRDNKHLFVVSRVQLLEMAEKFKICAEKLTRFEA